MAIQSARVHRLIVAVVVAIFLIVNLINALGMESDFDAYFEAGRRLLEEHEALYGASGVAHGFVGPPAQALLFAPLAPFGPLISRLIWYIVNVVLLWYALATWLGVLVPGAAGPAAAWRAGRAWLTTRWAILPLLTIAFPLQTQFEHENLNVVMLALAAFAADQLRRGHAVGAGIGIGLAAAIKVYPALALGWLVLRRQWKALGAAIGAGIALTLGPLVFRGLDAFVADVGDWSALVGSGWPTRRANQSIVAMWARYLLGEGVEGYPIVTLDETLVVWLAGLTALVIVVPLALASLQTPVSARRLVEELACVNALAVLISPIAWEHYFVVFFPLCVALAVRAWWPERGRWLPPGSSAAMVCWIGLVCITLVSRPIVGWQGARVVRAWSLMTWGGILLCTTLAALLAARSAERAVDVLDASRPERR